MSTYIAGFIVALVLAALVIAWIAYCMFIKERHKSEVYHYDITDIRTKNIEISQELEETVPEKKTGLAAGIFILPSRHKQKEDTYDKRPDYPEGPVQNLQPGAEKLVELFNESTAQENVHINAGYEIDSSSAYHSDV